jgi:thiol-disulfide isomerase/thioredoxin
MASNLVDITSATDFQENLSKDLDRVSVTYFWATWAEPCKKMTEVVGQLAKKHEKPLFLKVSCLFHLESLTYDH